MHILGTVTRESECWEYSQNDPEKTRLGIQKNDLTLFIFMYVYTYIYILMNIIWLFNVASSRRSTLSHPWVFSPQPSGHLQNILNRLVSALQGRATQAATFIECGRGTGCWSCSWCHHQEVVDLTGHLYTPPCLADMKWDGCTRLYVCGK